MKCPVCQTELKRILYGGMPVFRCFGCAGYLIPEKRFETILQCEEAPIELLKQEVLTESKPDTIPEIKCPRCFYVMLKLKLDAPISCTLDVCRDKECGLLWLDGGELARVQLAYKMANLDKSEKGWNFPFSNTLPDRSFPG